METFQSWYPEYYSHWLYPAVHVAVTISKLRSVRDISKALTASETSIQKILKFLAEHGLVLQQGEHFSPLETEWHLPSESPLIPQLHRIWRDKAIDTIIDKQPLDLHFSTAVSLTRKDADTIRTMILDFVKEATNVVRGSAEEDLFAMTLDWFQISK